MRNRRSILIISMILLAILLIAPSALAHSAFIKAEVNDGKIVTQSFYSGDQPMKQAKIRVYDSTGKQLLEAKTDDKGKYEFDIPKDVDSLKIVVQDLLGLRAEKDLSKEELYKQKIIYLNPSIIL